MRQWSVRDNGGCAYRALATGGVAVLLLELAESGRRKSRDHLARLIEAGTTYPMVA